MYCGFHLSATPTKAEGFTELFSVASQLICNSHYEVVNMTLWDHVMSCDFVVHSPGITCSMGVFGGWDWFCSYGGMSSLASGQ